MLLKIPTIVMNDSNDDPPLVMNGSGSPVTGISPTAMPRLINICTNKTIVNPRAVKLAKWFFAAPAI